MNRIYSLLMILAIALTSLSTIGLSQTWSEDFEGNWSTDWHITFGSWEVGIPTSGPNSAYTGTTMCSYYFEWKLFK